MSRDKPMPAAPSSATPQSHSEPDPFAPNAKVLSSEPVPTTPNSMRAGKEPMPAPAIAAREVTVAEFIVDPRLSLELTQLAGVSGLSRPLRHPRIQKNGLALAGHLVGVVPTRVQILGETELAYLTNLPPNVESAAARAFFSLGLSCVIVTKGQTPPPAFLHAAEATQTPLFRSGARTSVTINAIHACLDERLAPTTSLHGVLVDVFGIGMLLLGKSGIGKSECALELVLRGHRLVADDVVLCDYRPPGMVFGAAASLLRHHIEIRGLGILNIQDMFGVTSVRERKRIDIIVKLAEFREDEEYDRLGVEDAFDAILGARIRCLNVPVRPGRDMGSILEIAARNELLRRAGTHSARKFVSQLEAERNRHESDGPESAFPPASAHIPAPESSVAGTTVSPIFNPSGNESGRLRATLAFAQRVDAERSMQATDSEDGARPSPAPFPDRTESSAWIPAALVGKDEDP